MRVPYTWLVDYVKTDVPAEELAHILTMGGLEVEEVIDWTSEDGQATDKVLDTSVTSNRGDLLSMVGVARHAAALLGCEFLMPPVSRPEIETPLVGAPVVEAQGIKIEVQDLAGCPRYVGQAIRDLTVGPSPDWMRYRLEAAGIRPISNVVDVTNYVCWELGQPMHAFDLRLVARDHIIVRRAAAGEKLKLIDESSPDLDERDLMICDEMGPIGIAGVMGGLETEVGERCKSVLLESAHFDPVSIRRTSQRHSVSSQASYRFERHVDPNVTILAIARATQLILQTAGGTPDPAAIDVREVDFSPRTIALRPERCNAVLGTDLSAERMADCLRRLGMEVSLGEVLQVTVPTVRPDIEREIDLVEEVAIVNGYNSIPLTVPGKLQQSGLLTSRQRAQRRARQLLRRCGLNETISFSFMGKADLDRSGFSPDAPERRALELQLPVSPDKANLRTTLIPGLLQACENNVRQRVLDIALGEVDRVFVPTGKNELPSEPLRIAGALMGQPLTSPWNAADAGSLVDFFWVKGIVEQLCQGLHVQDVAFSRAQAPTFHPGRCAHLLVGGQVAGVLGEVSPAVQGAYDLPAKTYVFELDFERLVSSRQEYSAYDPLPRYPAALRDIALVVADDDAHSAAVLAEAIRRSGGETLREVEAFDLFRDAERLGEGNRSVAFRLTFRAPDRTLTDEELDGAMARIAEHLATTLGAEVRDR